MLKSIEEFITLLQSSGATKYLHKTWAYQNVPAMLEDLNEAYSLASSISGYHLVSIGTIWKDFINGNNIGLYQGNGIHLNVNGSYLTAAIFYRKLFNLNSIIDSPYSGQTNLDDATIIKAYMSNLFL